MEAPALAASRPAFVICSGMMGKAVDIVGVWTAPVMAQVMMALDWLVAVAVFVMV
jgi:hypothetical protein